jgi:hypothetical protein
MEERKVRWRIGGRFWASYFANETRSGLLGDQVCGMESRGGACSCGWYDAQLMNG